MDVRGPQGYETVAAPNLVQQAVAAEDSARNGALRTRRCAFCLFHQHPHKRVFRKQFEFLSHDL